MRRLRELAAEADRNSALAVLGGLALLVVYLYPGSHRAFIAHARGAVDAASLEWAAHGYQFACAFILMALVPTLWIRFGLREPLSAHGVALGDTAFGVRFLGVGMLVLAGPLWVNAGDPGFQAEYPLAKAAGAGVGAFVLWELCYLVYYVAWEFFFRGFWQVGLARSLGTWPALLVQTTASTLLHIGKPGGETAAAIPAGIVFGLVAMRTRSVLYVLLLHWYVGMLTDLFCILRSGGAP